MAHYKGIAARCGLRLKQWEVLHIRAFVRGLNNIAKHWFLIFNFIKKHGQRLRAEEILMPQLTQSPVVS